MIQLIDGTELGLGGFNMDSFTNAPEIKKAKGVENGTLSKIEGKCYKREKKGWRPTEEFHKGEIANMFKYDSGNVFVHDVPSSDLKTLVEAKIVDLATKCTILHEKLKGNVSFFKENDHEVASKFSVGSFPRVPWRYINSKRKSTDTTGLSTENETDLTSLFEEHNESIWEYESMKEDLLYCKGFIKVIGKSGKNKKYKMKLSQVIALEV